MRPVLFEIFGVSFPSYYSSLILGFLLATWLAKRETERLGIDTDDFLDLALWMFILGLIGARILHVIADGYFWDYVHLCTDPLQVKVPSFVHVHCNLDRDCIAAEAGALCNLETLRCHPGRDCLAALKFWQGGLAFYGGLLLAVAYGAHFVRKRKMELLKVLDLTSWAIALGLGFGRLGCFLAGCCFGQISEGPTTLEFPGYVIQARADQSCPKNYDLIEADDGQSYCAFGRPAFLTHVKRGLLKPGSRHSQPVHATQLYEMIFSWLAFLWLFFWRRRRIRFGGQSFLELMLLYGTGRFIVEFFRDDDRGLWLAETLSTSQLIALPLVLGALWLLWRARERSSEEAAEL